MDNPCYPAKDGPVKFVFKLGVLEIQKDRDVLRNVVALEADELDHFTGLATLLRLDADSPKNEIPVMASDQMDVVVVASPGVDEVDQDHITRIQGRHHRTVVTWNPNSDAVMREGLVGIGC